MKQLDEDEEVDGTERIISWEVTSYQEDELVLQIDFADPYSVSDISTTDFDELRLTFWGTEYFKDVSDTEVALGQ